MKKIGLKNVRLEKIVPYLGLFLVILIFAVATGGKSLRWRNIKTILEQMLVTGIVSIGYIFTMSAGALDYSCGSVFAVSSMVLALVSETDPWLALLASIATACVLNGIIGLIITKFHVPSSIIGQSSNFAIRGMVKYMVAMHGAYSIPLSMHSLNKFPLRLGIYILLFLVGGYVYNFTRLGYDVRAVGSGQVVSRYSGVDVERTRLLAFVLSGVTIGAAAWVSLVRAGTAGATTGNSIGMDLLLAMVLGGMDIEGGFQSRYISSLLGVLYMIVLSNGLILIEVDVATQQLLKGLMFVATMYITSRDLSADLRGRKEKAEKTSNTVEA